MDRGMKARNQVSRRKELYKKMFLFLEKNATQWSL